MEWDSVDEFMKAPGFEKDDILFLKQKHPRFLTAGGVVGKMELYPPIYENKLKKIIPDKIQRDAVIESLRVLKFILHEKEKIRRSRC